MNGYDGIADFVLAGGGVKGIGLVGAIEALHDKGYGIGELGRAAGTSAGAIVASLVAARMPMGDLVELMQTVDYRRFQDSPPFGALGRGISLLTRLGLYRGDYLHGWIRDTLEGLGVRTFGDLRRGPDVAESPEGAYRLVVIVSDVTSGRMVRLPMDFARYGLEPDEQSVADAVRASAAIPFFFRPVQLMVPDTGRRAVFTDGGMLSNFPITVFDRPGGAEPRWPTFGIKLSPRPPAGRWQGSWAPVRGPVQLGKALVSTMVNAHDRLALDEPAACARTVFVETDGIRATQFDVDADIREDLYRRGRARAEEFLSTWDFEAYKRQYRR
jgi:NTE family protein